MTAPINELFKQTLDAVTMLDGHAFTLLAIFRGDTGCDIELIARMRNLFDKVDQHGEDIVQRLVDLTGKVETTEKELDTAGNAAETALKDVAGQAPEVSARADAMDTDTLEKTAEIAKEREAAATLLDDEMSHAREDAARTLAAAEALAALLSTRIEETRRSMAELRAATQKAAADLDAAARRFLDAAAEVDRTVAADAIAYRAGIDALAQQAASSLTGLANQKVEAHNHCLGPLRQRLTEDEPRELHEAVAAVTVSMQQILRLCDERDDRLVQAAEKCEPLAEQGSSTLDRIVQFTDFILTI
jgi:predicted RNA-binding protein